MKLKNCRICNGNSLTDYLNLGLMPAADAFIKEEFKSLNDPVYPLEVCLCDDCGISQLNYTVDPKILFQNDYPYESSTTKTGRLHFDQFGESVVKKAELSSDDLVIDIGSNVGVLLGAYQKRGCKVLGIEPSKHIAASANENGVETINDFITPDLAKKIVSNKGQASVINITNVFAHIDDLDEFMIAIKKLLAHDGILVIEAPYLVNLIENLEYDTVYHEHLSYISLKPLIAFFKKFNLEIFNVEMQSIHGGTMRYFIGKKDQHKKTENVSKYLVEGNLVKQIYVPNKIVNLVIKG